MDPNLIDRTLQQPVSLKIGVLNLTLNSSHLFLKSEP